MARRRSESQWQRIRLDQRAQVMVLALLLVLATAFYFFQQRSAHEAPPSTAATLPVPDPVAASYTADMLLGNPSGATADPADRNNYLMIKPHFALAYNDQLKTANWVSWRLTRFDLGSAPRKSSFDPDPDLPAHFYRVTHRDYSASGFDRGHLCPHADRAASIDMSFQTFVMTNIIPQSHKLNERAWANLENYCRDLVRRGQRLYIIAGPTGRGGLGSAGPREAIGRGQVNVPAACWKVIVIVNEDGGADDLVKITRQTRVIAVIMPNNDSAVGEVWAMFRTRPAEIEDRAHLNFFQRLQPDVAAALRQKIDTTPIPPPRRNGYAGGGDSR
jgi:endonuclease G, mitochondrial